MDEYNQRVVLYEPSMHDGEMSRQQLRYIHMLMQLKIYVIILIIDRLCFVYCQSYCLLEYELPVTRVSDARSEATFISVSVDTCAQPHDTTLRPTYSCTLPDVIADPIGETVTDTIHIYICTADVSYPYSCSWKVEYGNILPLLGYSCSCVGVELYW